MKKIKILWKYSNSTNLDHFSHLLDQIIIARKSVNTGHIPNEIIETFYKLIFLYTLYPIDIKLK